MAEKKKASGAIASGRGTKARKRGGSLPMTELRRSRGMGGGHQSAGVRRIKKGESLKGGKGYKITQTSYGPSITKTSITKYGKSFQTKRSPSKGKYGTVTRESARKKGKKK